MRKKLNKGFNINLKGKAQKQTIDALSQIETVSLKPTDFCGMKRPKVLVNQGDAVKAGTVLFFDKKNEKVKFTSPVSGEVLEVVRGEKRVPLEIKILVDKNIDYIPFPKYSEQDLKGITKDQVLEAMLNSGVWANIIERPFGVVANPDHNPKNIFISAFDSNPLAPDFDFIFQNSQRYLQAGITALSKLTKGKVHLTTQLGADTTSVFKNLTGAELHEFAGPHPAGNVGVQIHYIAPINKGDIVWTLNPYGLEQIGKLFLEGQYDATKVIALTGSEINEPKYYKVYSNAAINKVINVSDLKQKNVRIISGNVLTGERIELTDNLGFHHHQITVIPEGNYHEFLGWIMPSVKKLSLHRAFGLLSFLNPKKEYVLDSNLHGEERAFVETGVFEQVVPMDIYPVHLLKSILANDFEAMEALGIYEVLEEDFALCEFVDVSKNEVQTLLRHGLDALMDA